MRRGTKGPKIRFPLGTFVEMQDDPGAVYEVVQLYQMKDSASEWVYRLFRIAYRGQKPSWERHKDLHRIWWEPLPRIPFGAGGPDANGAGRNWTRSISNQDMVRLALVRMDDLFDS